MRVIGTYYKDDEIYFRTEDSKCFLVEEAEAIIRDSSNTYIKYTSYIKYNSVDKDFIKTMVTPEGKGFKIVSVENTAGFIYILTITGSHSRSITLGVKTYCKEINESEMVENML